HAFDSASLGVGSFAYHETSTIRILRQLWETELEYVKKNPEHFIFNPATNDRIRFEIGKHYENFVPNPWWYMLDAWFENFITRPNYCQHCSHFRIR
ncbi:hypothetical protein PRIPAC_85384, partial [Pristionchus pacificus]|uniref:Uncharacterized protein n=1 Tax=Pristionchus pacificus TaxID=54126 RepID=A0A2A6BN10_PRIPA